MVVTYGTKKERRGTENRTKAWTYIYMPKIQILQKYPCAHTIYSETLILPSHISQFPIRNLRNRVVHYFKCSCTKKGPYCQARPYSTGSSLHVQLYLTTGRMC